MRSPLRLRATEASSQSLKQLGATWRSHLGWMAQTSRMYSLEVMTSSWQTTHSGSLLKSELLGWMQTWWSSATVRKPSFPSFFATCEKNPATIAFRISSCCPPQLCSRSRYRSSSPDSCLRTSWARRRERAWTQFSRHQTVLKLDCFHWWYTARQVRWSPSGWLKRARFWSATACLSLGRQKMFWTESIEMMVTISSEQPRSTEVSSILLSGGSSGNQAILRPSFVSSPSSSSAARQQSCSRAAIRVCTGGGSMKSKFIRSFIPIAFSSRTVFDRFARWISGTVTGSISCLQACSVYSRQHFPGPVLPARPARCFALACEIGATTSVSMPTFGLYIFIFAKPGSTTQQIPSIVRLASAMLVAITHLRRPPDAGSKIRVCCQLGSAEQTGRTTNSGAPGPSLRTRWTSIWQAVSISSWPVRKRRMSPAGQSRWIWRTQWRAASRQSASGCLAQRTSTGKVRPGILNILQLKKQELNFWASRVAEVTTRVKSWRWETMCLRMPKRTSVWMVRSWASSSMTTEYCCKCLSRRASRSSMPSVMYLIIVRGEVKSSNRIEYPTSSPSATPISSLTRFATLIAATRRGCVHPIRLPPRVYPASTRYCVICVVLPDPVSPITINTLFPSTAFTSSSLYWNMGSPLCCSFRLAFRAPRLPLLKRPSRPQPYSSPRPRPSGRPYPSWRCCSSRTSLRSLAKCRALVASRCSVPSGFLTTRTGESRMPALVVWPRRNGGSLSLISIVVSSMSSWRQGEGGISKLTPAMQRRRVLSQSSGALTLGGAVRPISPPPTRMPVMRPNQRSGDDSLKQSWRPSC